MILSAASKTPRPTPTEQAEAAKQALLAGGARRAHGSEGATRAGEPRGLGESLPRIVQEHPIASVAAAGGLAFAVIYFRPARLILRQTLAIGAGILLRQTISRCLPHQQ